MTSVKPDPAYYAPGPSPNQPPGPPPNQHPGPPPNQHPGPPPNYQPPPPGYVHHGNPPPGNTMVVVTQPTPGVVPGSMCAYRQVPCHIQCQYCGAQVITSTQYTVGTFTYVVGGIICLVGCYLGCCLIPCCVDGCKDVIHSCPNCKATVGRYNRL